MSNRYQDDELLPIALEDVQLELGVDLNGIGGKDLDVLVVVFEEMMGKKSKTDQKLK